MSVASSSAVDHGDRPRRQALDVLRGAAILCMLVAHGVPFLWPTGVSRAVEVVLGGVNAVASPLFGVAMGAAAALVWSRAGMADQWARRVLSDVARGAMLFALGVLLVELRTWVAIVLHVLGVLVVIGLPIAALAGWSMRRGGLGRPLRRLLAALTLALFVVAPWLTGAVAPAQERLPNGTTGGTAELWAALVAGQSYRALSLLPFFCLGALVAASGLLDRPRRLGVLSLLASAVLVPAYLLVRRSAGNTLSGDPVDQLFDLALVVLAVTLVALAVGTTSRRVILRPLADLGAIALSVYALQLVVLRPLMGWGGWTTSAALGWASLLVLVAVPSALMIGWRRLLGPGPLERVVALVTGKGRAS